MSYTISTDCGGTFTEAVVITESGEVTWSKTPSTPPDYSRGIMEALNLVARQMDIDRKELLANTSIFGNGTTIAINALATRTGCLKTALVTTKGHEDALIMGRRRQMVAGLPPYEIRDVIRLDKPMPIIPRSLIVGVTERIDYAGKVLVPLNENEVRKAIRYLKQGGAEAFAICLLWSQINPQHEQRIKEISQELYPDVPVIASSDISPRIGEYERAATTAINAMISEIVRNYAVNLMTHLKAGGFSGTPLIMSSTGGVLRADEVADRAILLLISGLVGGTLGSLELGKMLGYDDIIATDAGGTSFEVSIIDNGNLLYKEEPVFEKYQISIPVVDITAIGAAGGSIAWIEEGSGLLKVGPRSAAAAPGPVCYDSGGTEPTVTDADLILNRINPEFFLGGRINLNKQKAIEAMKRRIAEPLGVSVIEAAAGVAEIIDSHMADLMRRVTIMRGYDPRRYVMFSFGGSGPGHVGSFGKDLKCKFVVIPFCSSAFSAFGIGRSDVLHIKEISSPIVFPAHVDRLNQLFSRLETQIIAQLSREGFKGASALVTRWMRLKFRGQVREILTPVPSGRSLTENDVQSVVDEFRRLYETKFGRGTAYLESGLEATSLQVYGIGKIAKPKIAEQKVGGPDPSPALGSQREVYWHEEAGMVSTSIYARERLAPGCVVTGPAIIEAVDTTIAVHPGQTVEVDSYRNLLMRWE